jgi:hypothetical protein
VYGLIAYGTAPSLYGDWFYCDKIVHGLSPIGYVPVLYIALVRLGVVSGKRSQPAARVLRDIKASSSVVTVGDTPKCLR